MLHDVVDEKVADVVVAGGFTYATILRHAALIRLDVAISLR